MTTTLDVPQSPGQVWAFSSDPMAQKKWDRSVAEVEVTSPEPFGAGSTFRTIGPARRGRPGIVTSYRVAAFEPETHARIEVVESRTLRRAVWEFRFAARGTGTHIEWRIALVPKPRYFFLGPVLRANRAQLVRDMRWFRAALDEEFPP
ncbi:hypothetical protein BJY16_005754 [Actinoplanes octamycinicus]|uniref:Polyketide cyclase/dehydrase/lipid transport protein n=1 Tax=Actinoplanes octamycinicus TaxID=135948 RepID=A0A7W7H1J8_9ACTN|nr:SRPBCC family protein [Actinoplanes octamycinicus]MBB4742295.1 hypothetical protein [Actinoplanes octamycinicus]GIE59860.1 hypothetical protein Aoc01nite_52620 [Actinoplanes octamycinicus]